MAKNRQENKIRMNGIRPGKTVKRIGIFLFWIVIWQILTWCVGNRILLAGPWDTVKAWVNSVQEKDFVRTCLYSVGRIGLGVLLGFAAGFTLGCLGYKFRWLQEILSPLMTFLKSVPVAAFAVLLLIWWGSKGLSVAVVFIVVLPLVYINVVQGLLAVDKKMLEMAKVFRLPIWNRFFYIYRPALRPYMDSCLGIALGMSWKSGVAAEVIGTPEFSIGEQMYMSKIYLDTAGLFAWTATLILLSFLFEKCGLYLWKCFCLWKPGFKGAIGKNAVQSQREKGTLQLENVSKNYGGNKVLENINKTLEQGKIYCLMAPSGAGKTTLLRILAGLEEAEEGKLCYVGCSFDFQEDRLAEHLNAVDNVMMVLGSGRKAGICENLLQLLPEEGLKQTCKTLSGGMKRRVSLVRAVMAEGDVLLLDEPFSGLDEENKKRAAAYLLENQRGRTVVVATHDETDVELLGAVLWKL